MSATGRKRGEVVLTILTFGLTLLALLLAYFRVPIGVSGEWSWGYCEDRLPERLIIPGAFLALYLVVVFWALAVKKRAAGDQAARFNLMSRPGRAGVLLVMVLLLFCLQITAPYLSGYGATETFITMSLPHSTGAYFIESQRIEDPESYLRGFAGRISLYPWHEFGGTKIKVHPPGNTLFIYYCIEFARAHPRMSAWFNRLLFQMYPHYQTFYQSGLRGFGEPTFAGLFLAAFTLYLIGSLTLTMAYFLTRQIAEKETAFFAAAFVGLIPSILLFSPAFDQVLPALALLYSFFLIKALRSRRLVFSFLAGFTLSLWSFLQLSFLVMLALTVFALVLYFFALPGRKKRLKENFGATLKIAASLGAGFLVPNLLLFLLHYNAFQVFWINLRENSEIYTFLPRTYWKWALLAIPDFFLFMGIPLAGIFLWAVPSAWRALVREKRLEIVSLSSLALMLTLFLIAVWGQNKGEVARLLIFLGPIATILGLVICRKRALLSRKTLLTLLILLAVQLILFRLFFDIWYSQDLIRRGDFG